MLSWKEPTKTIKSSSWPCTEPSPRVTTSAQEHCPNASWTLSGLVLWPLPWGEEPLGEWWKFVFLYWCFLNLGLLNGSFACWCGQTSNYFMEEYDEEQAVLQVLVDILRNFSPKAYAVVERLPVTYLEALLTSCLCDRDSPLLSWQKHSMSGLLVSWSSVILWYDECSIQTKIKILQDLSVALLALWFSCKEWFQTLLQANE